MERMGGVEKKKTQQDIQNILLSVANRKHATWSVEFWGLNKKKHKYILIHLYLCIYTG